MTSDAAAETPSTEAPDLPDGPFEWHRIIGTDELPVGRVTTVAIEDRTYAVTRSDDGFGVLDNHCPHQGGPLGEGSIEKGWLRCPWHGYDYSPCNGVPPSAFGDAPAAFRVEVRDDGVYAALPLPAERERTVADIAIETLIAWGMTHVFGMVGHSNLGLADAMRVAEERGDLTFIGIRHEGAAAFAASAYGKLTGGIAGCFGIAGPGSTNLLTGLYDAKVDRAPVVALSGLVPSSVAGQGAFQDLDLTTAFSDVARYQAKIVAGSDVAELAAKAAKTAIVERDVVHLSFPDEVQTHPAPDAEPRGPEGRVGAPQVHPPLAEVDRAVQMIAGTERPVIIVGAGARGQMTEVMGLAETIGAPVLTTFKAKGLVADDHELGCGVLGRSGTPIASWFMNESDLLVVFGASFSNHTGIADYKPTIQVDLDQQGLGRYHPVDLPLLGHVGTTASVIRDRLPDDIRCVDHRAEVAERWAIWREEKASRRRDDQGEGVNSAAVFEALGRTAPADAVFSVDVGNNTYSFGRYLETSGSQDVLMSGYLGSIGFALPGAMGAYAAVGDTRKVISVSGDGGLGQYAMELTTIGKYGMPICHVLLDNQELGKISKEQRAGEWPVWQTSLVNPDWVSMAESCGVRAWRVTTAAELEPALREAVALDGPALVHIVTDVELL
ncbi:thiamine pyrophosphate-dependent enzyme [Euzebya tangerina]|uniref:thiamine pyrophosphate-dependent enzyme n=1 Tax=Euzebya tangerina TaxID=591198 RepID=UPI000E3237D9|nr:thiamine pyrophosphate-dependent enzyme [Euzebya tangerina]